MGGAHNWAPNHILWRQPLLRVSLEGLEATRYLDGLEEQVTELGTGR